MVGIASGLAGGGREVTGDLDGTRSLTGFALDLPVDLVVVFPATPTTLDSPLCANEADSPSSSLSMLTLRRLFETSTSIVVVVGWAEEEDNRDVANGGGDAKLPMLD